MTEQIGKYGIGEYEKLVKDNLVRAQVNNAGISDVAGLQQATTTLTQLIAGVVDTKFYELQGQKLSDFCKIEVGKGAYSTDLLQYAVNYVGQDGQGWINPTANGIAKDANHTIQIGSLRIKNHFWRGDYTISNELVQMGRVNDQTFSIIEANERGRKKSYDLEIQKRHFLGFNDSDEAGLLNQPDVTVNATLAPHAIEAMTDNEFEAFVAGLAPEFGKNALFTMSADRLLVSSVAFASLGKPFGQYGLTRREVLENALKGYTGADFKVVHATYCDKTAGDGAHARYALYNTDVDNLCAYMPVPYTPMPLFPQGSLDLISQAHAQYVQPYLKRTNSMLYIDVQA